MALITYHQTLITFVLFYTFLREMLFPFFQSFSPPELPVHRYSGGNFRPECCFRHLSAGIPMNRELGRAERLKEEKVVFMKNDQVLFQEYLI